MAKNGKDATSLIRHKAQCTVCKSPNLIEIRKCYVDGMSLREIELKFTEVSKDALYRHLLKFPGWRNKRSEKIENVIDRIIDNGTIGKEKIDGRLIMDAVKTKLKLQGKLQDGNNSKSGDTNINLQIVIEGHKQLEKNRLKAYSLMGYPPADN